MRIIHTFLFVFLLFWGGQIHAQALINQLPISGNWALIGDLFVDEDGNYIYVQKVRSSEGSSSYPRYTEPTLKVGGQLLDRAADIEAGTLIPCQSSLVYDFYILKISPEFELVDYQVISQVRNIVDVTFEGGKLGMVFSACESASIFIGEEEYPPDLDSNNFVWATIFNANFELEWVESFPTSSVSQICPAGAGDSSVYLGVNFPTRIEEKPIFLLGDTIRNHRTEISGGRTHLRSVMILKYDIRKDSIVAKTRIGGDLVESELLDFQLNQKQDLVTLSNGALSRTIYFGEEFTDSATIEGVGGLGGTYYDLVLAQFDQDLNFTWATTTPEALYDIPLSFKQDSEGSIYVRGDFSYGDTLRIRDTILIHPIGLETSWSRSKQGIIKFDSVGAFQWIHQIEGGYDRNFIYSFRVDDNFDQVIVSTNFDGGYGYFGDTLFETIADSDRRHTTQVHYGISTETGAVEEFYYGSYGYRGAQIYEIEKEEAGRWRGILDHAKELFFGQEISGVSVLFFQADPNAIVSAIEQAEETPLTLYPNPAPVGDRIRLDGLKGIRDIQAIHISGQPAPIRWTVRPGGAELVFLDQLPLGLYLLQVETEVGIHYAKVQIQ